MASNTITSSVAADNTNASTNQDALYGIVLSESAPIVQQKSTLGAYNPTSRRADRRMQEQDWTLNMMVERFNWVQEVAWVVGTPVNTVLQLWKVPADLLVTPTVQVPFNRFVYWRGSVKVRFQLNATRFHQGRLIAYFVPLTDSTTVASWHQTNMPAQTTVQHVFLDPSVSTVAELVIPYVNYKNYLNLQNPSFIDFLGQINLAIFNPLQAATGSSSTVYITVSVSFPDSQFKIPSVNTFTPTLSLEEESIIRNIRARGEGNTSSITNKIDHVNKMTMPIEVTGDRIDAKASIPMPGMDKVNVTIQPPSIVRKPFGYMNHATNVEFLNKMTLEPSALNLCDEEHFGTNQDEMSLAYLTQIPTYMQTFPWATGNAPGTIIASGLLAPGAFQLTPTATGPANMLLSGGPQKWFPTLMEYVTMPHSFWKGGLVFHFDFVATAFQTGRLWLGLHFGTYTVPTGENLLTAQFGTNIELGPENHHFTYEIPFLSSTEWKRVPNGGNGPYTTPPFAYEYFLGSWSLSVLNVLTSTEGTPASIDINHFVAGAKDYEVSGMYMNNTSLVVAQGEMMTGAVDTTSPPTMEQREEAMSIVTQPQRPVPNAHFGETYSSVRQIIKRYSLSNNIICRSLGTDQNYPALYAETQSHNKYSTLLNCTDVGIEIMKGSMGWYGQMYRLWRGSVRFKILWDMCATLNAQDVNTLGQAFSTVKPFVMFDSNVLRAGATNTVTTTTDVATHIFTTGCRMDSITTSGFALVRPGNYTANQPPLQPDETGIISGNMWRSPPVDYARGGESYSEIEVPFSTLYNVLSTFVEAESTLGTANGHRWQSPGTLWMGMHAPQKLFAQINPACEATLFTAAGDDFRFGLLLGPHLLLLQGVTVGGGAGISFSYDYY